MTKLSELAQKLMKEFGEAIKDFACKPNLNNMYDLSSKRQALESYIRNLETKVADREQSK